MNKNVLIKGILLLAVIALLTIGLTGCGLVTFYASYIYIDSLYGIYGDVYLDGSTYLGYLYPGDYVTAYHVSYGPHTVEVYQLGYIHAYYTINVSYTGQSFGIY